MFTRNPTACCVSIIAMLLLCDARLAPADVQTETLTDSRDLNGSEETRPDAPMRFAQADRRRPGGPPGMRGGGRRRPGSPRNAPGPQAKEAQIEKVLDFVREHFPERAEQLQRLRRHNPREFRRRIPHIFPRIRRMMQAFERNPETAELMVQQEKLSMRINITVDRFFDTDDAKRQDELRGEIQSLVIERFGIHRRMREREIKRLERRLEAVRDQLKADVEQEDAIIERELRSLGLAE